LALGTVQMPEIGAIAKSIEQVEVLLMEPFRIDEIARKLFESVPPAFRSMQQDLEANFRSVLRSSLSKLDVVTREEFDTQVKVLERTRAKLEALEKKVAELEEQAVGRQ
jgi:BMFP domain-containing protein YqiC